MTPLRRWPAASPTLTDGVVLLRAPRPSDVDDITAGARDPDVQRFTKVPSPYEREHAQWFVDRFGVDGWGDANASGPDAEHSDLKQSAFAVTEVPLEQFVGAIGLHDVDLVRGEGEVGYWLSPAARGRGVMTRAVGLLLTWAFDTLELATVRWEAVMGNDSSRAIAEKHGFVLDGTGVCTNGAGLESPAWTATLTADQFRRCHAG